ncbi:MAG: hydrogenase iron-sulfur subunit [Pseudomonadota bacterium]
MADFEPQILAFCCNWCTYAAADLAGISRMEYPANVRVIRVMCSGMVSPMHVLRALERGADGVLIAGCHHSDCHYMDGPDKCDDMYGKLKKVIHTLGIEPQRLRREVVAASEGVVFVKIIREMVSQLKPLGPSPFKSFKRTAA